MPRALLRCSLIAAALARVWPGVPTALGDELALALEVSDWPADCAALGRGV